MIVIGIGLAALFVLICVTALVEAWARHAHWTGFDDRPVRYDRTRRMGRPW